MMKKKIMAGLLTLCMIFSLFPSVALAGEADTTSSTIYVDAENGNDSRENAGTSAENAYQSLKAAVNAAKSGDTIQLAAGTYTLYNSGADVLNKDLTFVGSGTDQTTWLIGPKVPDPAKFGTEYNSDYSLDVRSTTDVQETVTFKNMTLQSGIVNYLGFAGTDITVVEDCVIDGKTFYWGNTSATFRNTTFNCPEGDYGIWTYGTLEETFDGCTFNSSGKMINVYADYEPEKNDVIINFKDCTVNNASETGKPVLNINDQNKGTKKYYINISGNNTVSNVVPDNISCSRLFGFSGKPANNGGNSVVTIAGTTIWSGGKSVVGHAHDISTEDSYNNGVAADHSYQYSDGYKDDAFKVTYGEWTTDANGITSRVVTKVCEYCGYSEQAVETLLDGDILIGDETEHSSIYQAKADTKMAVTGSLNMAPVKAQMKQIRDNFAALPGDINLSDMTFVFTATLILPDELDYTEAATATLDGSNGSFEVTSLKIEGKKAIVEFQPANLEEIKTFAALQELVENSGDDLKATVDGIINNSRMQPDTRYTIEGSFTGSMQAKATHSLTGREIDFNLAWTARQSAEGADFIDPENLDAITFTLEYPQTYTVTYHANYGSSDQIRDGGTYVRNATHTTLNNDFDRSGYRFTGWNTEPDGSGTSYDAGQTLTITENVDLYAQWKSTGGGGTTTYYVLSYESNGGTDYPSEQYASGTQVSLSNTPTREGYEFTGWYEDAELTTAVTTVTMDRSKTVYAGWKESEDPAPPVLIKDHYAYIIGYPDGTVQPTGDITRAEVATIFFRLLTNESRSQYWSSSNRFTDVNEGDWYNNAISTLTNAKILDGYPDGTFQPNGKITRAEFTKIAASFFEKTGATENPFTDVSEEDWFYSYVLNGYESGIISGYPDGTFRPNDNITRAEAMAIVNRTIGRAPDKEHFLPDMKTWVDNPESEWYYEDVQEATNSHDYNMMNEESVEDRYEIWTKMLETRDWAALELQWAQEHNQGGEVISSALKALLG